MVRVIECVKAHYEVQDQEMGKVYRWCPESVVLVCDCGEDLSLTASRTTCGQCGADHVAFVGEVLEVRTVDKVEPPGAWCALTTGQLGETSVGILTPSLIALITVKVVAEKVPPQPSE